MLRARTSMMNVRMNYKNGQEKHKCRFCNEAEETQEHVIQDCQKIKRISDTIRYAENNMEKTEPYSQSLNPNQQHTRRNSIEPDPEA